jgi:hypothetical protein
LPIKLIALFANKYFAMKKILNFLSRKGSLLVVAMVFLARQSALGNEMYLAKIGPPPFRYAYVDNNNALFMKELALPKPTPVAQPPMPLPQPKAEAETNNVSSGTVPGALSGVPLLPVSAQNAAGPVSSASDMLSINPQMISEYFKPYREDGAAGPDSFQHGDAIFVPAELSFVPPTSGSRAIYNSK